MSLRLLLAVGVYFLALTYPGLTSYFDTDDMMNLYGAWHRLPDQVRPAGALFYRSIFELAGFNPLPFRIASFLLLLVNLALFSRLLNHLSESREAAAAALFFGCYQGAMWMIYASTGMIYDVLCATFLYAALLTAIERPGWWPVVGILQAGAMSSKELGATLPFLLVLYSLFYKPVRWPTLLVTTVLSAGYAAQRLLLPGPLTGHEAYTPVLSFTRLMENVTAYTNILFSHSIPFTAAGAVLLWLALFGLAAAIRSWRMAFGLLFFWAVMSPMLTATPRHAGYVFYVGFLGLALAAGALYEAILPRMPRARVVAFVLTVAVMHHIQTRTTFKRGETPAGADHIRRLAALKLPLKRGQRVLLIDSPGLESPYLGAFTLTLTHRVRDLTVDERASPAETDGYDHVYRFRSEVN